MFLIMAPPPPKKLKYFNRYFPLFLILLLWPKNQKKNLKKLTNIIWETLFLSRPLKKLTNNIVRKTRFFIKAQPFLTSVLNINKIEKNKQI